MTQSIEPVSGATISRMLRKIGPPSADLAVSFRTDELHSILTELQSLRTLSAAHGEAEAWRVKDYADGWWLVHTLEEAHRFADNGNLIQPLYLSPASTPLDVKMVRLPDWEASHSERLSEQNLQIAGLALDDYAYGHLALGYAVTVTVREVGRLIDAGRAAAAGGEQS